MKAWRVTGQRKAELIDMGSQSVEAGCVKLKMLAASLTPTECDVYNSAAPNALVLGRNGVGLVTETGGDVTGIKRGDTVYVRPVSYCGECAHCRSGKKGECEHSYTYGKTEDGVLRDFITVPQSDAILLPGKISAEEGVFIETVALAVATLDKLKLEKGEHIVIVGATDVGLALAQVALYYQAVPIVVDMRGDRLELAEKLGIYYTINIVDTDPVKKIFSITCGKMAETAAYCLLSGMPLQRSFDCLARFGRAAIVGMEHLGRDMTINLLPIFEKNVTLAPVSGADDNYLSAVNMLASRAVNVQPLITKKIPFESVGASLAEMGDDTDKYAGVVVEIDKL